MPFFFGGQYAPKNKKETHSHYLLRIKLKHFWQTITFSKKQRFGIMNKSEFIEDKKTITK